MMHRPVNTAHRNNTLYMSALGGRLTAEHVVDEAMAVGRLLGVRQRLGLPDDGHIGALEMQHAQEVGDRRDALQISAEALLLH